MYQFAHLSNKYNNIERGKCTHFLIELCFIVVAHDERANERIEDYKKIVSGLDLPKNIVKKSDGWYFVYLLLH